MIESKYLLRSLLFVPGHNRELLEKAKDFDVDALILDLEDSVSPASNKRRARSEILRFLQENTVELSKKQIFIRVNDRESGYLLADLTALTIPQVDGFIYPKSSGPDDIYFFDKLLETIEHEKTINTGKFKIIALIETAAAVLNAQAICEASDRLIAVAFGSEDYIADINGIHDSKHLSLFTPRALIAMAARATGKIPIDTVHVKVHDLEDLEENLKLSRNIGFEGMLALHPKELGLIHKYYGVDDIQYGDALEMIELSEKASTNNQGVALEGSKFIGPPMVAAAKKLIARKNLIDSK